MHEFPIIFICCLSDIFLNFRLNLTKLSSTNKRKNHKCFKSCRKLWRLLIILVRRLTTFFQTNFVVPLSFCSETKWQTTFYLRNKFVDRINKTAYYDSFLPTQRDLVKYFARYVEYVPFPLRFTNLWQYLSPLSSKIWCTESRKSFCCWTESSRLPTENYGTLS